MLCPILEVYNTTNILFFNECNLTYFILNLLNFYKSHILIIYFEFSNDTLFMIY